MDSFRQGIEPFLKSVSKRSDLESLVTAIKKQQDNDEALCTQASEFALHIIIDLYDEASDHRANTNRIVTNLENAAHELQAYIKRIKNLLRD
jgi:hypothetical protein